ncbi:MAG: hypothetical protein ABI655_08645 [Phenylobacterium sp.]
MKRIDLDDLPPKIAAILAGVEPGEAVLLVKDGLVFTRLTGGVPEPQPGVPEPEQAPEERVKEIFEQLRSIVEDDF